MEKPVQLQELQGLLNELSAEVAELSESVDEQKTGYVSALNTGLADLLTLMRNRKDPEAAKITVNVNPTPVTVKAVLPPAPAPVLHFLPDPSAKSATWEVTFNGRYGERNRTMIIKRTQ